MTRILINGDESEVESGTTVTDVVKATGRTPGKGVAVAINGEVVPRGSWEETVVAEDDRVEVLNAIGGG